MRVFKKRISVIMPAYNEGHHIYENLRETISVFSRTKREFEIVVVDDGSADDTTAEARRAALEFGRVIPVRVSENRGKGNALREGFKHATGDFVIFLDADLDLHPEQVRGLFRAMRDTGSDIMIGSKHHPASRLNYPMPRKMMSLAYAFALKALFDLPLRDTQTGLKIFTYASLCKVFPMVRCERYAFDVELLAYAHHSGFKVNEAPVALDFKRSVLWGRISLKDVLRMGMDTLGIFLRLNKQGSNGRVRIGAGLRVKDAGAKSHRSLNMFK